VTITSADEFVRLRTSDDPDEYLRAANDDAPLEVWLALLAEHREMRFWVAHNKTVPPEVLEQLADDDDARVREMVARKHRTSEAVLARLARDPSVGVRLAVAGNRNTPRDALVELETDSWPAVAELAARRLGHGGKA
jgi:leucine rich repeat (LRR) protein